MGLESVEIVLDVEATFDVRIPDEAAEKMETVGDLLHFLVQAYGNLPRRPVLGRLFRRLRKALSLTFRRRLARIRPGTVVSRVFPYAHRPAIRRKLQDALGFRIPGSVPPRNTVGALTRAILAEDYPKISAEFGSWDPRELWPILQAIVAEHLNVQLRKVKPQASFVKDLGMR